MAEDTAAELLKTRKELEGYAQELQDIQQPLDLATATDDPVSLTIPQVKNYITQLENLKTKIHPAQTFLTREETDEGLSTQDDENRKRMKRDLEKARQLSFCLKYSYEAHQHAKSAKRDISRIEKNQTENPHKDYSTAVTSVEKKIEALETSINSADLADENELWETLEQLKDRLVNMMSHEVVPKETKDFPKIKPSHKVTPLVVPTFSGKVENWRGFWDEFDHAINKRMDMEDITKLVYLKQAMQDPNLKMTLSDLGVSEEAYPAAIKLLEDRFNKPRILHRQYCEALTTIPTDKATRVSLTEIADKAQRILTGFKRLKTLEASQIVTSMVELAMSQELKHEWMKRTNSLKLPPPAEKIIEFIRERADQAQEEEKMPSVRNAESKNRHKPNNHRNRSSHAAVAPPTPAPAVVSTAVPTTQHSQPRGAPAAARTNYPPCKYQCPLCPEKHYPYHCSVFKALSTSQRNAHATANSLCTTCLKPGHAADVCHSTFKCKICKASHNSLLHEEPTTVATPAIGSTNSATSESADTLKNTLLMTAEVLLTGTNGMTLSARAFLDGGSNLSIVSCVTRTTLALRSTGNSVRIDGVGDIAASEPSPLINVTISSSYKKGWKRNLTAAVMPKPTRDIPILGASDTKTLSHLQGLALADKNYDRPGAVDILLGQDIWDDLFLSGRIKGPQGTPSAWHTVFGWVVTGLYVPDRTPKALTASAYYVASNKANQVSDGLLVKFWLSEEPPNPTKVFTAEEQRVEDHYENSHRFLTEEGRYEITLPRTLAEKPLGDSRKQALNRAKNNEESLIKKGRYSEFQAVMTEYVNLGHAKPVSLEKLALPSSSVYYMPVHSVRKESSTSTKIRAVFDASAASTTGVSLNDLLAVGPTIQSSLNQILMKFRLYHVAVSGDISKMYREILLSEEDKSLHRYFWRKDRKEPWVEYEMQRVTFGVTASPYVVIKTLQQTAKDFGDAYPSAQTHIFESFYVDDFLAGAATPEAALTLTEEVTKILSKANFTIRKWRSSSTKVLEGIPKESQEVLPSQDLVETHAAGYPKALGLLWDSRKDMMATQVELSSSYSSTKRGVVSDISKTFDVLGWLSPVILKMKLLYRELWIRKLEWDQEVPDDLKLEHKTWRQDLLLLADVRMPRCYFTGENPKDITLHGFSDASKNAFSAVIYIRATYASKSPSASLVLAKTRVAPLDGRSIPELELCGAHLLAQILSTTSQTLGIPMERVKAYSDSTIVLAWLDGSPKRDKIYVANRICKTNKLLPTSVWGYVPTAENPADCASRGISASELLTHHLWWHGPPWLRKQPLEAPPRPTAAKGRQQEEENLEEESEPVLACNMAVPTQDTNLEEASNSFSTLVKITCWVRRFISRMKGKPVSSEKKLSVAEALAAEDFLIKRSQARTFSTEIRLLSAEPPKPLQKRCHLVSLQPEVTKGGILRVGGRLNNSSISESQKHPVILSTKDILTVMILTHYHLELGHGGPTSMIAHSGNKFYISGARRLARSICSKCTVCRRASAKAGSQLMGQLPPSRLDPEFVFFETGLDYAGPFTTLAGHTRRPVELKTFLAIFVCFHTKAVHLELVRDATTTAFVACLARFCGRRGLPMTIHSDHGTNFMGAKNQLSALYDLLEEKETQNAIHSYLFNQKVTWDTIPVRAPHFGGLWEAAVKAAKFHLKRLIGDQRLQYDELETIIISIEACLNSRPLGAMASHPLDGVCPLTPGHFLIGRALKAYPVETVDFSPTPLQRWLHCQKIVQSFWKRWSQEYLQQLQRAVKWHKRQKNYQVGDIVLLTDGNVFLQQWSTAKIIKVYPGKDGAVRAVDVQVVKHQMPPKYDSKIKLAKQMIVKTAVYRRPITKLAMLLSVDEVPQCCQIPEEDLPTEERMKQAFIAGEDVMSSLPQP